MGGMHASASITHLPVWGCKPGRLSSASVGGGVCHTHQHQEVRAILLRAENLLRNGVSQPPACSAVPASVCRQQQQKQTDRWAAVFREQAVPTPVNG